MFPFFLKKTRLEKTCLKAAAFAGLVSVLLTGLLFVSCPNDTTVDAERPNIIDIDPAGGEWNVAANGGDTFTLTVTATITDGGTLSYQWYENTANSTASGEEVGTDSDTLTLAKGGYLYNQEYYFFVVVTNTNDSVSGNKTATATSSVVAVTVSGNLVNARPPSITVQPQDGTWNVSSENEFSLMVTATSPDNGTLSYQWYKNTTNSTTGGTTIGTNSATLSLAKANYATDGNRYFYVMVTNTKNGETATATSNVAKVTVYGNEVVIPVGLDGYFQTPITSNLYNDPFYDWPPSGTFWDDGIAIDLNAKTLWYYSDSTMQIGWGGTIASLIPETNTDPALLIVQITEIKGGAWGPSVTGVYFPISIKNFAASMSYATFSSANPNSQSPDAKNGGVATLAEAVDEYTDAAKVYFGITGQYVIHPVTAVTLADLQGKWELEDDPDMYIHIQGTTIMIIHNDPDDDDEYSGVYSFMSDDYCIAMGEIVDYIDNGTSGIMYVRVMWSDDYDNDDFLAVGWNNKSGNFLDFYVGAEEEDSLADIKTTYGSIDDLEDDQLGTFTKQ
jgi:quinol monooxygenase YgiN